MDYIEFDFARSKDHASNPGAITRAGRGKGHVLCSAKPSNYVFFEFNGSRQQEHFLWIHGCKSGSEVEVLHTSLILKTEDSCTVFISFYNHDQSRQNVC